MKLKEIFGRPLSTADVAKLPHAGVDSGDRYIAGYPGDVSPRRSGGRVDRAFSLDVETFDAFKAWCRTLSTEAGEALPNSAVLRMLILAHPAPTTHPRIR